ncbi:MAG: hypothetical protein P8O14_00595 [SAR86 cluster bacterium]|nr:hypothetical protein [SAR86 cluster bacterium]
MTFEQKSVNEVANITQISEGEIFRKNDVIRININTPFKEQYSINESYIEINDLEFNQTKLIEIHSLQNQTLLSILKLGFKTEDIKNQNSNSFSFNIDGKIVVVRYISNKSFSVDYLDNLNILNTIVFREA